MGKKQTKKKIFDWRWWFGVKPKFARHFPKEKKTISVIIPAYNEENSIRETILSIQKQTVHIDEVVVVDDCSSDKTGEISRSMGAKVVRTAVNQGTKAMAQEYVLKKGFIRTELFVTIDGDTILHPSAIERTLPYFNDPLTASVCGFVIPAKIKTIWERGRFVEYIFGISLFKAAQNNAGAVLVSSGCFSIFRSELVKKMGGFKARSMAEDMDLTWEFALNGYHVYCVQNAYCYPYDPPTFKIFVNQIDRWYRSFFQNISIHKKELRKNKKLALFIYGYLVEALFSPFIIFGILLLVTKDVKNALLLALISDVVLVSMFVLVSGIKIKMFWKVLFSIPAYMLIRPVNLIVFWRSFWKEWIKKEPLAVWNKGH
ncbi:MAG: glycosyltransferase family 2 protein [Candidatus Marinimicrobia bacterium]|nr:glycosyltransferase family 2 protein [Candidatus Neomarinimicrobiota bacterium]